MKKWKKFPSSGSGKTGENMGKAEAIHIFPGLGHCHLDAGMVNCRKCNAGEEFHGTSF